MELPLIRFFVPLLTWKITSGTYVPGDPGAEWTEAEMLAVKDRFGIITQPSISMMNAELRKGVGPDKRF